MVKIVVRETVLAVVDLVVIFGTLGAMFVLGAYWLGMLVP